MRRFWRIYKEFARSSIQRELEFRANFIAKVLRNMIWIAFFIVILLVTYSHTDNVAGWNRYEAAILAGSCFAVDATIRTFAFSLMEIPQQIRMGTLDFVVTKPVDAQLWVSLRKVSLDQIGQLSAAILFIGYGAANLSRVPSALDWVSFTTLLGCATLIFFSIMSCLMTLGIWFVRVDNLWVLGDTAFQISRFPIDIFPVALRRALTYFLPLAFISTIPAMALRTGWTPGLVGLGLLYAVLSLGAARAFWLYSVRHYSSASS